MGTPKRVGTMGGTPIKMGGTLIKMGVLVKEIMTALDLKNAVMSKLLNIDLNLDVDTRG